MGKTMTAFLQRVRFGQLVTMADGPGTAPIGPGELILEGERISKIRVPAGDGGTDAEGEAEILDLSGHLILPGFVNAHCHLGLSALGGRIGWDRDFTQWIREVVRKNKALEFSARVAAIKTAASAMTRSGVTFLVDYLSQPELLAEYATLPFRQLLLFELLGFPAARAGEVAARAEAWLAEHPDPGNALQLGLAPHAPYSVSPALFQKLKSLAAKFRCPISCHLAEVAEESVFLKDGGGPMGPLLEERQAADPGWRPPGMSPVRALQEIGCLAGMQAVHLNCVEADDWPDLPGLRGAVFCPGSTRWFRRGRWLAVRRLLDLGVAVGLGTDSLASNDSLDFLREIRLAGAMLPEVSRSEILWMATAGGARSSGVSAGVLAPGQPADFIAFRLHSRGKPWEEVVWDQAGPGPDLVFMRGRRWQA